MEPIQPSSDDPNLSRQWATPPRGELDRFAAIRSSDSYIEIGNLLTQFHRTSPVRTIAEGVLGNTLQPGTPTLPLFNALANPSPRHWREQVVAAWALARVPLDSQERDAAAGMLLETLDRDEDDTLWERILRGLLWGYGTMLPLCLLWSLMIARAGETEWADVFPQMLFVMGSLASVLTIPLCLVYGRLTNSHSDLLQAASAESLGRLRVVESIGPLAQKLFEPSVTVQEASAFALMQILPNLTEADYGALDQHAINRLADALNHPNALLVFKILEALEKVGTGTALPAVERLTREGKTRQLQETARKVTTVLEARQRREHEARHLMRPTSGPDDTVEYNGIGSQYDTVEEQVQSVGRAAPETREWL